MDTLGANTSEDCLKAEILYKAIRRLNKVLEEAMTRTPTTITSYTRLLAAGELARGAINISQELMKNLCR